MLSFSQIISEHDNLPLEILDKSEIPLLYLAKSHFLTQIFIRKESQKFDTRIPKTLVIIDYYRTHLNCV